MKSPYFKPNADSHAANYVRYIATREGVERAESSARFLPATRKQKEIIGKLVLAYPDAADLFEHQDYVDKPNRGNADELILRIAELHGELFEDREKYVSYIAERPRVEKLSSHGLFSDERVTLVLEDVAREIRETGSNVWTHIISLTREDAARLGYDNADAWVQLLRSQRNMIAANMKIAPENFHWYAAFHNESHHPHVHMMAFSSKPGEAFLTENGIEQIKSELAKEIFRQDLIEVYQRQTSYRDELRAEGRATAEQIVAQINGGTYKNPKLESLLLDLAARLSRTKGKKQYGYLKPDVKAIVDQIVDLLAEDERIQELYELWYEQREEVLRTYTDTMPERESLRDNKEFKPLKNAVIEAAMGLALDRDPAEEPLSPEEVPEPSQSASEEEATDPPPPDAELSRLLRQAEGGNRYAQYQLAKLYLDRKGEHYAPDEAVRWLKQAAAQGYAVAAYRLGKLYLTGDHLPRDTKAAEAWLRKACDADNDFAQYLLGKSYLTDSDFDAAPEEAERLLSRAAEQHNKYAAYTLGKEKLNGNRLSRDPLEAIRLLSVSADLGFAPAMYLLGRLYTEGEAVPRDLSRAIVLLEHAADQGNSYAGYLAGKLRLNEDSVRDIPQAIRDFELAAAEGNAYAEYQLGRIYLYGIETEPDREVAVRWLRSAADHGNAYASQLLQHMNRTEGSRAAMGAFRLLNDFCRIFQRRLEENRRHFENETDRKLLRQIEEKKAAHGLKQG